MNESLTTVTGNVATDPRHVETDGGLHITSFRLASTPRRWDARSRSYVDQDTSYYSVTCWRFLAQNVAASVRKGDPIVVTGSLRVREWEREGKTGVSTEIDARAIGHDLNRGVTSFTKVTRTRTVSAEEDEGRRQAGPDADEQAPPAGVDLRTGEVYAEAEEVAA